MPCIDVNLTVTLCKKVRKCAVADKISGGCQCFQIITAHIPDESDILVCGKLLDSLTEHIKIGDYPNMLIITELGIVFHFLEHGIRVTDDLFSQCLIQDYVFLNWKHSAVSCISGPTACGPGFDKGFKGSVKESAKSFNLPKN